MQSSFSGLHITKVVCVLMSEFTHSLDNTTWKALSNKNVAHVKQFVWPAVSDINCARDGQPVEIL